MDVLGVVIAVTVLTANTHDNTAGIALLDQVADHTGGTVRKALAWSTGASTRSPGTATASTGI
uniref:Transposase IS4 family protein n=1 Tax=Streptomyces auratus AGR0001 TaxID=1160718 RepID=J1RYI4_9ACTN|nr:hypothetical protein [Streptomyces auratus]